MTPLRVGLVGCGHLAREVHLPVLTSMPDATVVAVADPDPAARAEAVRLAPRAEAAADLPALLALGPDAVVVCTPTATHAEVACDVLAAGVPLYLEKPVATTLDDAERVVEAWRAAGVPAMLGFNYRLNPLYAEVAQRVREGEVGAVIAMRTVFSTRDGGAGWRGRRDHGGGVLLDLAAHHVDLARYVLTDEVMEVSARLASRQTDDDTVTLDLRTAGGAAVQTFCSLSAVEDDRIEVVGEDGVLRASRYESLAVERGGATAAGAVSAVTGHVARSAAGAAYLLRKRGEPWNEPSFRAALARFAEAVRTGRPAEPDPVGGYRCLAVLAAARESAREGRVVTVSTPPPAVVDSRPAPPERPAAETNHEGRRPDVSAIALAMYGAEPLRTTFEHLAAQTVRDRIEVVCVAADGVDVDLPDDFVSGFAGWQVVRVPDMQTSGEARAVAVRAARAPIVVALEDHCFPEPRWAEGLLAAFDAPRVVGVGPSFQNANPATRTSWADYLLNFGAYADHAETAAQGGTAWHNTAYRRDALLAYGDALEDLLDVEGPLQHDLRERGGVLVQSAEARVRHLNFSHPGWFVAQHVVNGRQFGAARSVGWSSLRRAVHAVTAPLIPFARLRGARAEARRAGRLDKAGGATLPLLIAGLTASAIGEVVGSVFGAGRASQRKLDMEHRRHRFMAAGDRRRFGP